MGQKVEWYKTLNGKNIEWKKRRMVQNVEWKNARRMGQNVEWYKMLNRKQERKIYINIFGFLLLQSDYIGTTTY